MSKLWSSVGAAGAWALDAEREDAEEAERAAAAAAAVSSAAYSSVFAGDPVQCFPIPKEAAKKKMKKKKGVAIPLSVFAANTYVGPGDASREITADQIVFLPTGPCDRAPGELENYRIGGGFRCSSYGGRFSEEVGRGQAPSRADGADNWASVRKPCGPAMDSGRNAVLSKADEVDNWSSGKIYVVPPAKNSGLAGSGLRTGTGIDSDRWGRGVCSVSSNAVRERPKLVLHPRKQDAEAPPAPPRSRPNPFSAARPREEVLAEKGLDWKKMEMEMEIKKAAMSSQSSRSSSTAPSSGPGSPAASQISGEAEKLQPSPKANLFGDAKPREVLLEEKGMDWMKIDRELEHRLIERPVTDGEMLLKEEIQHLKEELEKITNGNTNPAEQYDTLLQQMREREQELDDLIRELDDKVRFGRRDSSSPSSGSSRANSDDPTVRSSFSEKWSTQTGFADRNTSRWTGGSWGRSTNVNRGYKSSRGNSGVSRRMDGPKSSERW